MSKFSVILSVSSCRKLPKLDGMLPEKLFASKFMYLQIMIPILIYLISDKNYRKRVFTDQNNITREHEN